LSVYYDLVFDIPTEQSFTYKIDELLKAAVGKRAMVPFGRRESLGYIISERDELPQGISEESVKNIRRVVDDDELFDSKNIELAKWMAGFYFCSTGQALSAMIPSGKKIIVPDLPDDEYESSPSLSISDEQAQALRVIKSAGTGSEHSNMFYLFGITGSGKTEVLSVQLNICLISENL